jgi:hypothetical protein
MVYSTFDKQSMSLFFLRKQIEKSKGKKRDYLEYKLEYERKYGEPLELTFEEYKEINEEDY